MTRIWASETSNKIDLNDEQMGEGFIYESKVKSNFFNGVIYTLQKNWRNVFLATPNSVKGQIVRVLTCEFQNHTHERYHWDYYICVNNTDTPPISGASLQEGGYWALFSNSYINVAPNPAFWKKITKLVQAPNYEYKYRPKNDAEYIAAIKNARDIAEIDTSRLESLNGNYTLAQQHKGAPYINSENFTITYRFFSGVSDSLDLSKWNTSKCTSFGLLYGFKGASVDISTFNTSRATALDDLFYGCANLTAINLAHWNTRGVTSATGTFRDCTNLRTLDLSFWDVARIKDASRFLSACVSLQSLFIKDASFNSLQAANYMFYGCRKLSHINMTAPNLLYGSSMYQSCTITNASEILLKYPRLLEADGMFMNCVFIDTNPILTQELFIKNTANMFRGSNIETIMLGSFTFAHSLDTSGMFRDCKSLSGFLGTTCEFMTENASEMFMGCSLLTDIPFSKSWWNSDLTNALSMFESCTSLERIDVSRWVIYNNKNYRRMFYNCANLTTIGNASGWNVDKATDWSSFTGFSKVPDSEIPPKFR